MHVLSFRARDRAWSVQHLLALSYSPLRPSEGHRVKDIVILSALVLAFATFVTMHVLLVGALVLFDKPRWRGLVALLVPPLAPIWAYRAGRRRAATVWIMAVVVYAIALIAAKA